MERPEHRVGADEAGEKTAEGLARAIPILTEKAPGLRHRQIGRHPKIAAADAGAGRPAAWTERTGLKILESGGVAVVLAIERSHRPRGDRQEEARRSHGMTCPTRSVSAGSPTLLAAKGSSPTSRKLRKRQFCRPIDSYPLVGARGRIGRMP